MYNPYNVIKQFKEHEWIAYDENDPNLYSIRLVHECSKCNIRIFQRRNKYDNLYDRYVILELVKNDESKSWAFNIPQSIWRLKNKMLTCEEIIIKNIIE